MKENISRAIQKIGWRYERINQLMTSLKSESDRLRFREVNNESICRNIEMLSVLALNELIQVNKDKEEMMRLVETYSFLLTKEQQQEIINETKEILNRSEKLLDEFMKLGDKTNV